MCWWKGAEAVSMTADSPTAPLPSHGTNVFTSILGATWAIFGRKPMKVGWLSYGTSHPKYMVFTIRDPFHLSYLWDLNIEMKLGYFKFVLTRHDKKTMDSQGEGGHFHGWKDRNCELHFAFGIFSVNKDRCNARITYLPMNWKYL